MSNQTPPYLMADSPARTASQSILNLDQTSLFHVIFLPPKTYPTKFWIATLDTENFCCLMRVEGGMMPMSDKSTDVLSGAGARTQSGPKVLVPSAQKRPPEDLPNGIKKIYGQNWTEKDEGYTPLWAEEYCCTPDGEEIHNDAGPAIAYVDDEDGKLYTIWVWHNQALPDAVGERAVLRPHELTVEEIDAETDMEVRRVLIERFTPSAYLAKTESKVIDMDVRTVEGGAPRALLETAKGDKWLCGTDGSTDRCYYMSVPREAMTCKEAHEMIAGVDEENIVAEA